MKVHVQPPRDWTTQYWQVSRDDGALFCNTFCSHTAAGDYALANAEFIAAAVNAYVDSGHDLPERKV